MAATNGATPPMTTMEVLIGAPGPGGAPVQAVLIPGERAQTRLALDPRDAELRGLLDRLRPRTLDEAGVQRLGGLLFEGLLNGEVGALYREARGRARAQGAPLRLLLTPGSADLAELPWEFMYDSTLRHHLVLTPDVRLARNLISARPINARAVGFPLRVLLATASPQRLEGVRLEPLNIQAEIALIQNSLAPLVDQHILSIHQVLLHTAEALTSAMAIHRPHIFHYIGHSGVWRGRPVLVAGDGANGITIGANQLSASLRSSENMQMVVLNSCWSAQLGVEHSLFGLAPAIADAGVPAVIGWQTGITDASAPWLAQRLYDELARGAPVDDAMAAARIAMYVNSGVERLAWGLAVLYLRQEAARLVTPAPKRWKLLVIDDEQVRADLLKSRLRQRGVDVEWASGGQQGVDLAPQMRPDVIVLDLKMPGMDGYEVLRHLRQHPVTAAIPVVVLSSLGFDYDAATLAYIGGARYVIPFNGRIDQLEQVLQRNLGVPLE